MADKLFTGRVVNECPFVHCRYVNVFSKPLFKPALIALLHKDLLRGEACKKKFDIVECSGCDAESTGRDIQKSNSCHVPVEMDRGKIVVFFVVEELFVICNTGSHELGNTPFYYLFRKLRIFELVANCNLVSGPHKFRQIGIN